MGLWRVTLAGTIHGNTFNNVLHLTTITDTPSTASAIADHVDFNWIDNLRTLQHNQINYLNINVRSLENGAGAPFNKTINKLGTALSADQRDLPTVAAVLRFQTNVAGRIGRGRYHMCGVSLSASANLGILTAATLSVWQPKITTIKNQFNVIGSASDYSLVICNRETPLQSIKAVTNIVIRAVLGTMRSRNYGVGV